MPLTPRPTLVAAAIKPAAGKEISAAATVVSRVSTPAARPWLHPLPLGLLLGGVALSIGAAVALGARIDSLCAERFVKVADQVESQIKSRLDSAVQILRGAQGFWSFGNHTDRATWQRYAAGLAIETVYPGTTGPDFAAPVDPMFDDPVRREAMVRARDSGEAALSARQTMASGDRATEPGFQLFLPVYRGSPTTTAERRATLEGLVYLSFRSPELMKNSLGYRGLYLRYAIYDGELPIDANRLFQTQQPMLTGQALERTTALTVAGRRWTMASQPGAMLPSGAELGLPRFVAAGGTVIAALLYGLALAWVRTRQRALELAGQMTADLQQREQQLAELSTQLSRSNEDLQQFAYAASHDLKEPLRSIASSLGLLGQRYSTQLDDTAREFIGFANDGAQRLSGLIDNLLDFSHLHTQSGPLVPVALDGVLDDALRDLSALLEESRVEIRRSPLPQVLADRSQVLRVFENLITNAIKYSRHHAPRPQISIGARREETQWIISVSDNGIGIAPEHHEKIFQMFKRLHSRNEYAGNGMGLALCKRIVQHHGGQIRVESAPGEGATFCFSLPQTGGRRKGDTLLRLVP